MRVALASDVHAVLPAFEAAPARAARRGAGDVLLALAWRSGPARLARRGTANLDGVRARGVGAARERDRLKAEAEYLIVPDSATHTAGGA